MKLLWYVTVPAGWTRALSVHTWGLSAGIQFRIRDESPRLKGVWIPAAVEGQALPAAYTLVQVDDVGAKHLERTDVVGGALDLNVRRVSPTRTMKVDGKTIRIREDSTFTLVLLARKTILSEDGKLVLATEPMAVPLTSLEGKFSIQGDRLILTRRDTRIGQASATPCTSMPMDYAEGWISSSEVRLVLCDTQRTIIFKRPG